MPEPARSRPSAGISGVTPHGSARPRVGPRRPAPTSDRPSREGPDLRLRLIGPDDPPRTAALHVRYLRAGLFPALGAGFLTRWHRTFIDSAAADGAVIVETDGESEGAIVGFILVGFDPGAHYQDVLRSHFRPLAVHGLLGLARRPRLAAYFARTRVRRYLSGFARLGLRGRRRASTGSAPEESAGAPPRLAVVHAVVADPGHRGHGLGRRLLAWAEERSAAEGVDQITLVTDGTDAGERHSILAPRDVPDATGFYTAVGWRRVGEQHRDGRLLVEFRRDISRDEGNDRNDRTDIDVDHQDHQNDHHDRDDHHDHHDRDDQNDQDGS